MIRLMPADTLPSASPPSMPVTPPRRTNSLPPPKSSGARPTKTCPSFGAFNKGFRRAADERLGIFLAHKVLPSRRTGELDYLDRRTTAFTPSGASTDDARQRKP